MESWILVEQDLTGLPTVTYWKHHCSETNAQSRFLHRAMLLPEIDMKHLSNLKSLVDAYFLRNVCKRCDCTAIRNDQEPAYIDEKKVSAEWESSRTKLDTQGYIELQGIMKTEQYESENIDTELSTFKPEFLSAVEELWQNSTGRYQQGSTGDRHRQGIIKCIDAER